MSKILDELGSGKYPLSPGFRVHGASEEAAAKISPVVGNLREQVVEVIRNSKTGLTADEAAARVRRSVLSVRPRVSELRRLGEIRPNGERGRNSSGLSATVWVVVPNLKGGE